MRSIQMPYLLQNLSVDDDTLVIQYADPDDLKISHQKITVLQAPLREQPKHVRDRLDGILADLCALIDEVEGNDEPPVQAHDA